MEPAPKRARISKDFVLDFGKFRGETLNDVTPEYLVWLSARHVSLDEDRRVELEDRKDDPPSGNAWLWEHKPTAIVEARRFMKEHTRCVYCGKPLVSIGSSRTNGKNHDDWKRRILHKKCWVDLL